MRAPLLVAVGLLAATAGTAPAQAAWQDTVAVSGATITAVIPQAPVVSCSVLSLPWLRITWSSVPHATHYVVSYGPTGTEFVETVDASVTHKDLYVLNAGSLSVRARYGSPSWVSAPSNQAGYAVVLAVAVCV